MLFIKHVRLLLVLGLSTVVFATVSCDKDDEDEIKTEYTLSGNATGAQEVPAVATNATGTLTGSYNINTNLLNYTITWTGLTTPASAMHFHGPAAPGASAPPVVPITNFPTTAAGNVTGTHTLTAEQEQQLMGGLWYYNIHTSTHTPGEIRAQVILQ